MSVTGAGVVGPTGAWPSGGGETTWVLNATTRPARAETVVATRARCRRWVPISTPTDVPALTTMPWKSAGASGPSSVVKDRSTMASSL